MALTKGQRKLTKSKQDSAAVSSLIGTPAPNEGDNGDIQVRMTDRGPRLFAKLGNKWWITDLKDATTSRQEVKMHFFLIFSSCIKIIKSNVRICITIMYFC